MHPFQLLFLLLLPLAVSSQGIPTIFLNAANDSSGNLVYLATLNLAIPPASSPTQAGFLMDTNSQHTILSDNCTRRTTKAQLWALVTGDGGVVANTADSPVGDIPVVCKKKHSNNIVGLGSSKSSFPIQVVSHLDKRPLKFAYVLQEGSGTLYIGRISWIQFTSIVPPRTEDVVFVTMPLTFAASGGYLVKLTGIGFKTFLTGQQEFVQVSSTQRFTTLPRKMYNFLLGQFVHEVNQRKIRQVASSYGNLNRCYRMSKSVVSSFPNVTMVFSNKSRWSIPADKYIVQKAGSSNVFCFAYLEAAPGTSGIIGTLQQQNRVMEFNLQSKTLGVSLPLIGGLLSP